MVVSVKTIKHILAEVNRVSGRTIRITLFLYLSTLLTLRIDSISIINNRFSDTTITYVVFNTCSNLQDYYYL